MQDRILKWALITLGALNIADYLLTLRAVYILGVPEGNPAMDALLGTMYGECAMVCGGCRNRFSVSRSPRTFG